MDPVEAAQAASLRYVSDASPGISRRVAGQGFSYWHPNGSHVTDQATIARIEAIVIPPAWTDVWISPTANGHLQATGRDAKGRKQHRYHERWRAVRDENKFARLAAFGRALPRVRERVAADLSRPGLPREKVLALIVWFLETTFVRVGNEEYARANHSYGLTTLTNRHARVNGSSIQLRFTGKSGTPHNITLTNRRVAALMKRLKDVPGQDLFQYVDSEGEPHPVNSADVNDYLRQASGGEFTAKDFRTWAGTLLAVRQLESLEPLDDASASQIKTATAAAVKAVAAELRNTPAVCRKCYIHPTVLAAWSTPDLVKTWRRALAKGMPIEGLNDEESALVKYLERATGGGG